MDSLASFANSHLTTLPDASFSIGPDGHVRHHFLLMPSVPFSSSNYTDCHYTTHRNTTTLPQPIRHSPIWTIHIRARAGSLDIILHEAIEPALWPLARPVANVHSAFEHQRDLLAARSMRFRLMNAVPGEPMVEPFQRVHVAVPRRAPHEWNRIYRVYLYPRAAAVDQSAVARALPHLSDAAVMRGEYLVRGAGAVVAPTASFGGRGEKRSSYDGFADLRGVRLPASTVAACRTWARVAAWHEERARSSDDGVQDVSPDALPLAPPDDEGFDAAIRGSWHRSMSAGPEAAFPLMVERDERTSVFWAALDAVVCSRGVKLLLLFVVAVLGVDVAARGSFFIWDDVVPALAEGAADLLAAVRQVWSFGVRAFVVVVYVLDTCGAVARAAVSEASRFLASVLVILVAGDLMRFLALADVSGFVAEILEP